MNSRNELFDYSKKCIKERRNLKVKVKKLTNECIQNNCANYLRKMNKLNLFELNNENSIINAIKLGNNFHFNKVNYNKINKDLKKINSSIIDEAIKLDNDYKFFCDTLKNDFSINELEAIKSDQLYYIPNINIRSNLKLNKKTDLQKSDISKTNILQINKTIYDKFCNYDKKENQKVLKNIIKVKKIIKSGINNLKNEEKKKIMKKEKIRKILDDFHKQSKKEVNSLIKDTSYKKLFNSIDEEIFLKEYYKKRCNSIILRNSEKEKNIHINKTQNNIISNDSYNKKINIYPRIASHSLIINEKKNLIRNRILNCKIKNPKYRFSSFSLSNNFALDNSSLYTNDSKENLMRKRVEENLQKKKEEENLCNKLISKIKANYARNNSKKLSLKF